MSAIQNYEIKTIRYDNFKKGYVSNSSDIGSIYPLKESDGSIWLNIYNSKGGIIKSLNLNSVNEITYNIEKEEVYYNLRRKP